MVFVKSTEIAEFEKRCLVALFMDYHKDFSLIEYVGDYHFKVQSNNKDEDIYLFNKPQTEDDYYIIYQEKKSQVKKNEKHCVFSNEFLVEYDRFKNNSFEYIKNIFEKREWEEKYNNLFDSEIPDVPSEFNILYKYKMNPEECKDTKGELIEHCSRVLENKDRFQQFIDGKIAFCNPNMFNDPFDCDCEIPIGESLVTQLYWIFNKKIAIKIIKRAIEIVKEANDYKEINIEFIRELLEEINNSIKKSNPDILIKISEEDVLKRLKEMGCSVDDMKDKVRVLCLSPHNDDILMWGYYGNSGYGLCCGYDEERLFSDIRRAATNAICIYGKVKYEDKKPIYNNNTKAKFNGLWEYVINCMFTKYKKWMHEDEFRIVLLKNDFDSKVFLVDGMVESYYLGCRNIESPLERKYKFPKDKNISQLKKDKTTYKLVY